MRHPLMGIAVVFVSVVGVDALATAATPVVALAYEYLKSEVAQALLVYACGPLYFVSSSSRRSSTRSAAW